MMLSEVNDRLYLKKDDSQLNNVINALIALVIIVLVFEVMFSISYSGIYVIGRSMNNSLNGAEENIIDNVYIADKSGDYVYVNRFAEPDYGDIVVINKNDKTTIIKRIIAKGGDSIKIDRGKVYLKRSSEEEFQLLEEAYVSQENNSPSYSGNTFHNTEEGYLVEEGSYFVLGDNRNVSLDSREDGGTCYKAGQVYGVVADWSLKRKSGYTRLHKFFSFDLPEIFGIDNRVKRQKSE